LWFRLVGAFGFVIVVTVGTVIVLVGRNTAHEFDLYLTATGRQWAVSIAPALATYYDQTGSWQGVETVLANPWSISGDQSPLGGMQGMMGNDMLSMHGSGMGVGMWSGMGQRLILTDADGRVVADTANRLVGAQVADSDLEMGAPIEVGGSPVGWILGASIAPASVPANAFLASVNRTVILGGVAAIGLTLVVGSVLFLQITRPLRSLAEAAQGIAAGDLSIRVESAGDDEVARLARTFNQMASALEQDKVERRDLIADIAHELRTPLTIIQGNLEAMLDGMLPASPEELAATHQETLLLSRLIADLRTLSLADAGQLVLERERVDVAALAEQSAQQFQARADEKQITLRVAAGDNLPPVAADPDRLRQVLRNLLDNALRYTPSGGVISLQCSVTSHQSPEIGNATVATTPTTDSWLLITVQDTGPGIAREDLPHVFDRFWRAEKSRNRASGGSGIGLALVRQLVEAHGGRVWAESQPGTGARFSFTLPLQ
ncbi:MAG: sensor histidine kinase, partial [Anaerolineales bacterium]